MNLVISLRGGLVPQASETGGDYYEQFDLDYGCKDSVRISGFLKGLVKTGALIEKTETDPFLRWLNAHLESGVTGEAGPKRIKPFYVSFK
jgi:hypothetical protein